MKFIPKMRIKASLKVTRPLRERLTKLENDFGLKPQQILLLLARAFDPRHSGRKQSEISGQGQESSNPTGEKDRV
jgi:hypothetical protein